MVDGAFMLAAAPGTEVPDRQVLEVTTSRAVEGRVVLC